MLAFEYWMKLIASAATFVGVKLTNLSRGHSLKKTFGGNKTTKKALGENYEKDGAFLVVAKTKKSSL